MSENIVPAWARESAALRLPGVASLEDLSTEWAFGNATGESVRIAVIDSGIEADHPALDRCVDVARGVDVALDNRGEPQVIQGPHDDVFGHGTACASIIHSIAPAAELTSVRVLGANLSGKAAAFLAGLEWAIEQRFDVINLSLGASRREFALPFYELCDHAYFSGSFVVTAANNFPRPSYPSLFASVTSVACSMTADPLRFHYNPEPPTEFLARGIDVEVAWRGAARMVTTGNSFAAPHISGLAALVLSKHRHLRPFQLKTVLWATAANVLEAPPFPGRYSRALRSRVSTRRHWPIVV